MSRDAATYRAARRNAFYANRAAISPQPTWEQFNGGMEHTTKSKFFGPANVGRAITRAVNRWRQARHEAAERAKERLHGGVA